MGGDQHWGAECQERGTCVSLAFRSKGLNTWGSGMYLEMFPIYFYCKAISNENMRGQNQELAKNISPAFFPFLMFPLNRCVYISLSYDC